MPRLPLCAGVYRFVVSSPVAIPVAIFSATHDRALTPFPRSLAADRIPGGYDARDATDAGFDRCHYHLGSASERNGAAPEILQQEGFVLRP